MQFVRTAYEQQFWGFQGPMALAMGLVATT